MQLRRFGFRRRDAGPVAAKLVAGESGYVDVDGDLRMADNKQILVPSGLVAVADKDDTDVGLQWESSQLDTVIAGSAVHRVTGSRVTLYQQLRLIEQLILAPQSQELSSLGDTINSGASFLYLDSAVSGGNLTATPVIAAGVEGQELTIFNVSAVQYNFVDENSATGSALRTEGAVTQSVNSGDSIVFRYDGTYWRQVASKIGML